MPRNAIYFEYWQELAKKIAVGKATLSHSDLVAIAEMIDFPSLNPKFLPGSDLAHKSLKVRKAAVTEQAKKLWGLDSASWLAKENEWLMSARKITGTTRDDGKDDLEDVICPEILVRIYAVAYLFYRTKQNQLKLAQSEALNLQQQALQSLNIFIQNAVFKGYTRANSVKRLDQSTRKTIYSILIDSGISVGATGKYLPDPEVSLPQIITLLHKDSIRPEAYQK